MFFFGRGGGTIERMLLLVYHTFDKVEIKLEIENKNQTFYVKTMSCGLRVEESAVLLSQWFMFKLETNVKPFI